MQSTGSLQRRRGASCVQEWLRRQLRWWWPISREFFYLYSTPESLERVDDLGFAKLLAEQLAAPGATIEAIAMEVMRCHSQTSWNSNLVRYAQRPLKNSTTPGRQAPIREVRSTSLMMLVALAAMGMGGIGCSWLMNLNIVEPSLLGLAGEPAVGISVTHSSPYCDGPYTNQLGYSELQAAEADLRPRNDGNSKHCLAVINLQQNRLDEAINISHALCHSDLVEPLPRAASCATLAFITGQYAALQRHRESAAGIACSQHEQDSRICMSAKTKLALAAIFTDLLSAENKTIV